MKDTNSLSPDAPTGNIGARNCVSPTHRAEPLQPIKPSPSQGGLMGTPKFDTFGRIYMIQNDVFQFRSTTS